MGNLVSFDKKQGFLYTARAFNSFILGLRKPRMKLFRFAERLSFLLIWKLKSKRSQNYSKKNHYLSVPRVGDIVKGIIVAITKNEVKIDIPGFRRTGVVRGPELKDESGMYESLQIGDEVEATVVGAENENGDMELSLLVFRSFARLGNHPRDDAEARKN